MCEEVNAAPQQQPAPCVAAVGMFDGVHAGHRSLLGALVGAARERGCESLVLTFDRHPLELLSPAGAPRSLCSPEERRARLLECGVGRVEFLHFTPALQAMTGGEFLSWLRREFGVTALVVGFNNHFGSDRMDADAARAASSRTGVEIIVAEPLTVPGIPAVSSSAVRSALAEGDVELAARILGAPYSVEGIVVHGASLGRKLGFPTANLRLSDPQAALPAIGVYIVDADLPALGISGRGITNIGRRPSVGGADGSLSVETHILDADADMYGSRMRISFLRRLRPEIKFDSLSALAARLADDALAARRFQR